MLFEPQTAEMRPLLRALDAFVREELLPLERPFLDHDFDTLLPALQAKRQLAKSLGFWLPQIAAEHGGMGLSLFEHGLVSEVLGQTLLGHYAPTARPPTRATWRSSSSTARRRSRSVSCGRCWMATSAAASP